MTFSTYLSPGVAIQGGSSSGGGGAASAPLTGTGATITTSQPLIDVSQTWNNSGVTFTGAKINVTDTASGGSSLLMDLGTGGGTFVSKFSVDKNGSGLFAGDVQVALSRSISWAGRINLSSNSTNTLVLTGASGGFASYLTIPANASFNFGAPDAATPVAQTLSVQSVVAGTSNTAGANFTLTGSRGTGTGAGGNIVFQVAPAGTAGTAQNALSTFLEATSARVFNLYGTYTDASNYERLSLQYSASSDYTISVDKLGSGSSRSLTILTYGNATATFESDTVKLPNNGRLAWTSSGTSRGSADTILSRAAAGIVQFGTTSSNALGTLKAAVVGTTTAYTVATLPTGFAGARAYVTDALAPTFLGTLTGGGAVVCPVFYNGTAWVPA